MKNEILQNLVDVLYVFIYVRALRLSRSQLNARFISFHRDQNYK